MPDETPGTGQPGQAPPPPPPPPAPPEQSSTEPVQGAEASTATPPLSQTDASSATGETGADAGAGAALEGVSGEQPAPPAPPAPPEQATVQGTVAPAPEPEYLPQDWPFRGYRGPQPWEVGNTPTITHNHRMLTSGTDGEEVVELAALLERLGYLTELSSGGNPHAIYDTTMAGVVDRFCQDFGVAEDPSIVAGMTPDVVGPWLWETLIRAAHKEGN